ncbi:MAG TPA: hypothetical protein VIH42_10260 [Thermoguttaceae bacterium]
MLYKIGNFRFLALQGNPDVFKEQLEVIMRPGVDGLAIWQTGSRGRPFTLRSVVDAVDIFHARNLFYEYAQLIGADPVIMIWSDMSTLNDDCKVAVLDVRAAVIRSILGGVGGLNPPSHGWCECDWDLVLLSA